MAEVDDLTAIQRVIREGGVPSDALLIWAEKIINELRELRESVDDHEDRITALEP